MAGTLEPHKLLAGCVDIVPPEEEVDGQAGTASVSGAPKRTGKKLARLADIMEKSLAAPKSGFAVLA